MYIQCQHSYPHLSHNIVHFTVNTFHSKIQVVVVMCYYTITRVGILIETNLRNYMTKNEKTSKGLGTLASKVLSGKKNPNKKESKSMAGSLLTQVADKKKKKRA